MKWSLIFVASVGAAFGINLLIMLLVALLFYSGVFQDKTVAGLEEYLIPFALFSPLVASLVSCAFVTYLSRAKKLLHTVISTVITFALSTVLLLFLTTPISFALYDGFDRRQPIPLKNGMVK